MAYVSGTLLLSMLLPACRSEIQPESGPSKPGVSGIKGSVQNVVLIVVDTLRRDHVSAYGYPRKTTPHIDAFFKTGEIFKNATSSAPCTVPSVLQMLTGVFDWKGSRLRLAERLKKQGYATAAFVSQHHFRDRNGPLPSYARGFDRFDIQSDLERIPGKGLSNRTADTISDGAVQWLRRRDTESPFFLWLFYFDPHDPYWPPNGFKKFPIPVPRMDGDRRAALKAAMQRALKNADAARVRKIRSRPNPHAHFGEVFSPDEAKSLISLYDAEIRFVDFQIQRVFQALEESGQLEDTLVIFTSDHGERLGEHNRWAHCQSLHGYEINVPLMFSKKITQRPAVNQTAASTLDIVPTVLSELGIEYDPSRFDGVDLKAVAKNRFVRARWRDEASIQDDTWKLTVSSVSGVKRWDLHHIKTDPEQRFSVRKNREQFAKMYKILTRQGKQQRTLAPLLDETVEKLKKIGYIE